LKELIKDRGNLEMNKYTNNQVLKITLIIIGGIFFLSFITCLGVGGFLLSDDSQNTKTENKIVTKNKIKKSDNKNKSNLAKDKVKNKSTLSPEDKIKNKSTEIVTPKPTIKPTIKPTKVNTLDVQLAILRENFENIADIKYKESIKTIEIIPHDKSFMVEAMQAYNGDQQALSTWNGLIKNLKKISRQIEDDDMLLCLVNNLNKENYILIVNNGAVVYDFIKN
jgi:LAS superfamily LD-carboxypeptidase LdcB